MLSAIPGKPVTIGDEFDMGRFRFLMKAFLRPWLDSALSKLSLARQRNRGIRFGRWIDKSRTEAKAADMEAMFGRERISSTCHVLFALGGLNEHCDTSLGSRVMRKSGESAVVILVHLRQTGIAQLFRLDWIPVVCGVDFGFRSPELSSLCFSRRGEAMSKEIGKRVQKTDGKVLSVPFYIPTEIIPPNRAIANDKKTGMRGGSWKIRPYRWHRQRYPHHFVEPAFPRVIQVLSTWLLLSQEMSIIRLLTEMCSKHRLRTRKDFLGFGDIWRQWFFELLLVRGLVVELWLNLSVSIRAVSLSSCSPTHPLFISSTVFTESGGRDPAQTCSSVQADMELRAPWTIASTLGSLAAFTDLLSFSLHRLSLPELTHPNYFRPSSLNVVSNHLWTLTRTSRHSNSRILNSKRSNWTGCPWGPDRETREEIDAQASLCHDTTILIPLRFSLGHSATDSPIHQSAGTIVSFCSRLSAQFKLSLKGIATVTSFLPTRSDTLYRFPLEDDLLVQKLKFSNSS
ncbi:hypothetical protein C8J56DRAFT_883403 [Mycena floridula]|nr:hypothetical protein C8J56DRAFT_883403 [Mycena floridula]